VKRGVKHHLGVQLRRSEKHVFGTQQVVGHPPLVSYSRGKAKERLILDSHTLGGVRGEPHASKPRKHQKTHQIRTKRVTPTVVAAHQVPIGCMSRPEGSGVVLGAVGSVREP
jgi:hypothetical protein